MGILSLPYKRLTSPHAAGSTARPLPIWQLIVQQLGAGLAVGAIVVGALTGVDASAGLTLPGDMLVVAGLCFLLLYAGEGLALLVRAAAVALLRALKVTKITRTTGVSLAVTGGRLAGASVLLYGHVVFPNSFLTHVSVSMVGQFILPAIAVSWCVAGVAWRSPGGRLRLALLGLAALPVLAVSGWLLNPGFDGYLPTTPAPATATGLPFENPGEPGSYRVQTLSYGSGVDRWQPQYGADAALTTTTVDGTSLFAGFGFADGYLNWRRGYDFTHMPLNGLVWYPAGVGPFPLVLMVHGAHNSFEASEPGYAYLGEHLASRGYIVVSVDENFLNGNVLGDGEGHEVVARAWLLLKHLQVWRDWDNTAGNPFFGQVDLERIALIGHSRGGEAVAVAAELNRHDHAPVPAGPYNFGIRAVVALAPSDWFYQPNGKLLTLTDTSYLVLGGGHDADTFTFYGLAQYNRVHLTEGSDDFRALVYLDQANHGQFNSIWGDHDRGYIGSLALNRRPLMSGVDQRQAAKVFITGFLEAALN
jgi:dienelactone hydrolase